MPSLPSVRMALLSSAMAPAVSGVATLVPPTACQPGKINEYVSYTETGVLAEASAATSLSVRSAQPLSVCQAGLAMYRVQPLPVSPHTDSRQPRPASPSASRLVPPTAITLDRSAGKLVEQLVHSSSSRFSLL